MNLSNSFLFRRSFSKEDRGQDIVTEPDDFDPRFDPDRLAIREDQTPRPSAESRGRQSARAKKGEWFLKGPVPWAWLKRAMALPGKALAVGLILWRERGCRRQDTIYFDQTCAARDGVPKQVARRALRQLEKAGLIIARRRAGRGFDVTILNVPPADEESGDE
jgi:hypothetical protein